MQRTEPPLAKWQNMVFSLIALFVASADQISKTWIRANLVNGESLPETGLFRLTHIHNTGAAFGLFQDQSFLLTIVAAVGIVILLIFTFFAYQRLPFPASRIDKPALGLILGGTIGNLVDRLSQGYVTDFIDIGFWPSFNIADSAITVGIILFAFSLLFLSQPQTRDLPV